VKPGAESVIGRARHPRRALTLVELLIVLGLIALAGAVVLPAVVRSGSGEERREVRTLVVEIVRDAQMLADATGLPVHVRYHPRSRRFVVGEAEHVFPSGWRPIVRVDERLSPESQDAARRLGQERSVVTVVTGEDADAAVTLMTWSPGGLSSPTDWTLLHERGWRVRVHGDAIDGVRIE